MTKERLPANDLPTKKEEENDPNEKVARKKAARTSPAPPQSGPSAIRFRPVQTIVVLVIVILALLFLIFFFGLGRGGGRGMSGSLNSEDSSSPDSHAPPSIVSPLSENDSETGSKPIVRCELIVSFIPSPSDSKIAMEFTCRLDWIDPSTRTPQKDRITADNKADFEFALEKAIRDWRKSLLSETSTNIPVLAVRMTPFPGEGVFRKIETITQGVDDQINILRLETPSP